MIQYSMIDTDKIYFKNCCSAELFADFCLTIRGFPLQLEETDL